MIYVAYHPYPEDTFALIPDDSLRTAAPYQHERGVPGLIIDGRQVTMPDQSDQYDSSFTDDISVAKSESSFIDLTVTGTLNTGQCSVFVTGVKLDASPVNPNLRLYCVVVEDSLRDQLGGLQFRVPRKFLPDVNGTEFSPAARFDTLSDTFAFNFGSWALSHTSVVAFVQDADTRKVAQCAELRESK